MRLPSVYQSRAFSDKKKKIQERRLLSLDSSCQWLIVLAMDCRQVARLVEKRFVKKITNAHGSMYSRVRAKNCSAQKQNSFRLLDEHASFGFSIL